MKYLGISFAVSKKVRIFARKACETRLRLSNWSKLHCIRLARALQRETYKQKGNDMSTATLNGLRDYLYDTLSPANLIWLGKQLTEYGYMQEKPQKPYTKEELKARIELSERQFAEGKYQDFDEAMDELEREFSEDEKVPEMVEDV